MRRLLWWVATILAITVAGYAVVQYFVLDANHAGLVQMKKQFQAPLGTVWFTILFVHAASSVLALLIGPFTLSRKFREKNIRFHQVLGKIYMVGILFGGLSGLYLAFYATGGLVGKLGFFTLSILWFTTAYKALVKIKNKVIRDHQKWMIRNYSLTFAAVTLRMWLPFFAWLFGLENFEQSYAVIAWIAWVPNLLIAEWFIRKRLITDPRISSVKVSTAAVD